jgi:hypothetical protein
MTGSQSRVKTVRAAVKQWLPTATVTDERRPPREDPEALSLDQVYELLKNERRRLVLDHLDGVEGSVSMSDLSEAVAARENGKPVAEISSDERKRVYVGLHQCHLPKMDEAGVIEFDKDRGRIAPGDHAAALEPYRPAAVGAEQPSELPYLLISGLAALLLVASLVVGSVGGVPVALLGLLLIAVLLPTLVWVRLRERLDDR